MNIIIIISIIFVTTVMTMSQAIEKNTEIKIVQQAVKVKAATPLDLKIKQMVEGYPIEEMVPYILKQDPKTAAFLVAIAKKKLNPTGQKI